MKAPEKRNFDLDTLPVDVFDLADAGLTVESLTDGHGMPEFGASNSCVSGCCSAFCSCAFCGCSCQEM
jgi:hypothetical protein